MENEQWEANFSALITSIATQAIIALGLAPDNSQNDETLVNLPLARFNIDLLLVLQSKTENNLEPQEKNLLMYLVQDLQSKYITIKEAK